MNHDPQQVLYFCSSDADPISLAKYVLALLKKDKGEAELKDFCIEQLDVFLSKETKSFVNKVFDVVKHKRYIPGQGSTSAAAEAPPIGEKPPSAKEPEKVSSRAGRTSDDQQQHSKKTATSKETADKNQRKHDKSSSSRRSPKRESTKESAASSGRHRRDDDRDVQIVQEEPKSQSSRRRVSPPKDLPRVTASKLNAATGDRRRSRSRSKERLDVGIRARLGQRRGESPVDSGDRRHIMVTLEHSRSRSPIQPTTAVTRRNINLEGGLWLNLL